jgi:glucuronokinase
VGRAFARVGLLGNPSDGYGGKVIGIPMRNFAAEVVASPSPTFVVSAGGVRCELPTLEDALEGPFPDVADGLERLVLAAARRFARARPMAIDHEARGGGLTLQCSTTVPRQVGLAGSSAAIIATFRSLMALYGVSIDPFDLAEMALATEVDDLGIAAGPMDRVIQSYERAMLLELAGPRTPDCYRMIDETLVPPVLVVWTPRTGRPSGVTHSDLRRRWESGDPAVLAAMRELRHVVDGGLAALEAGDIDRFADAVDRNYRLRLSVTDVTPDDAAMVGFARTRGAAAKLCGSGGAVVVAPRSGVSLDALEQEFLESGFRACRPEIR